MEIPIWLACRHFIAAVPERIGVLRAYLLREYGIRLDSSRAGFVRAFRLVSKDFGKRKLSTREKQELVAV